MHYAIGAALIAIPAIVIVGMSVDSLGWKEAALGWGFAVVLTAMLAGGLVLLGS